MDLRGRLSAKVHYVAGFFAGERRVPVPERLPGGAFHELTSAARSGLSDRTEELAMAVSCRQSVPLVEGYLQA